MLYFRLLKNLEVVFHTHTPWGKKSPAKKPCQFYKHTQAKPSGCILCKHIYMMGCNVQIIMVNIQHSEISNMICCPSSVLVWCSSIFTQVVLHKSAINTVGILPCWKYPSPFFFAGSLDLIKFVPLKISG